MANYYDRSTWTGSEAGYVSKLATGLSSAGWTLYDNISATHKVYQSPAVNGATGVSFFIELAGSGGGFVSVNACIDWDATAHAGIVKSAGTGLIAVGGTGYSYFNALGGFVCVIDGTYNEAIFFGQPRTREIQNYSDGLCVSTGSMSIGATTVNVNADLRGHLYVGQKVAIQNFAHNNSSGNKTNREIVTISAISSTALTFSATSNAYDSGAKIGPPSMLYPVGGTAQTFNSYNGNYLQMAIQATGQDQVAGAATCSIGPSATVDSGTAGNYLTAVAAGAVVFSFTPVLVQNQASSGPAMGPCFGFIFAYVKITAGSPADNTKYTDGTNVFAQIGAVQPGSNEPMVLIGPTGDAPNFATQTRLVPDFLSVSDSIYAITAPVAYPATNGLNQGFN